MLEKKLLLQGQMRHECVHNRLLACLNRCDSMRNLVQVAWRIAYIHLHVMWIPLRIYGALKPRVLASSPLADAHNFAESFMILLNNFAWSNTSKTQQVTPHIATQRFTMHRDVAHSKRVQCLHPKMQELVVPTLQGMLPKTYGMRVCFSMFP
mgnify:CR=1 FL=1